MFYDNPFRQTSPKVDSPSHLTYNKIFPTTSPSGHPRSGNFRYRTLSNNPSSSKKSILSHGSGYNNPQTRRSYSKETEFDIPASVLLPGYTSSGTESTTHYPHSPTSKPTYASSSPGDMSCYNYDNFREWINTKNKLDYKHLYKLEKVVTTELRAKLETTYKTVKEMRQKLEIARSVYIRKDDKSNNYDQRIFDFEKKCKTLDGLRVESEKLKSQQRALNRVLERLRDGPEDQNSRRTPNRVIYQ